jgi:hypothetical protein
VEQGQKRHVDGGSDGADGDELRDAVRRGEAPDAGREHVVAHTVQSPQFVSAGK